MKTPAAGYIALLNHTSLSLGSFSPSLLCLHRESKARGLSYFQPPIIPIPSHTQKKSPLFLPCFDGSVRLSSLSLCPAFVFPGVPCKSLFCTGCLNFPPDLTLLIRSVFSLFPDGLCQLFHGDNSSLVLTLGICWNGLSYPTIRFYTPLLEVRWNPHSWLVWVPTIHEGSGWDLFFLGLHSPGFAGLFPTFSIL